MDIGLGNAKLEKGGEANYVEKLGWVKKGGAGR